MKPVYLAAAAAVAMVIAAPPAQAQQVVGVTSAVKNDVRVRRPNTPVARPVMLKQRIAIADLVQTGAKSQMQMVLLDRSVFTLGANARVTIDRYVYDPARNSRSMGATVGKGAFRFMSGRRTTGDTRINTPAATIGVRGTIFEGLVGEDAMLIANNEPSVGRGVRSDPATATLIVLRGPGRATTANVTPGAIDISAGGRTVTADRPMEAVYIPYAGAQPIGPFVISEAGLRQLQALLYPSVAQRLGLRGPFDPNRTFTEAPTFEERQPRGVPRRVGTGAAEMPDRAGAFGDDGPSPGMGLPLPLDTLRGAPPPAAPRRTQQPQPTPPPNQGPNAIQGNDTPPPRAPPPTEKVPQPQPTPAPIATPKPTPQPTPAPTPNLKAPPTYVAPNPQPTPTPSPNQQPPPPTDKKPG